MALDLSFRNMGTVLVLFTVVNFYETFTLFQIVEWNDYFYFLKPLFLESYFKLFFLSVLKELRF